MTLKQRWYSYLLRLVYFLHLRWPALWLQRLIKGELWAPKADIPKFNSPEAIVEYIGDRFQYRHDKLGIIPIDWVTAPRVFQHRLDSAKVDDGDCDDFHFWVANALKYVSGVTDIHLLSSGFKGGAHTTTVFRYHGEWKHIDYRLYTLKDPNEAPVNVARRYSDDHSEYVSFYVFETVKPPWRAAAIMPKKMPLSPEA